METLDKKDTHYAIDCFLEKTLVPANRFSLQD